MIKLGHAQAVTAACTTTFCSVLGGSLVLRYLFMPVHGALAAGCQGDGSQQGRRIGPIDLQDCTPGLHCLCLRTRERNAWKIARQQHRMRDVPAQPADPSSSMLCFIDWRIKPGMTCCYRPCHEKETYCTPVVESGPFQTAASCLCSVCTGIPKVVPVFKLYRTNGTEQDRHVHV
jgi:hypothetical protein